VRRGRAAEASLRGYARIATMDRDKAIAYPPGSYIREPAGVVHYLFTKDEVVEVEVRGMGPRANIYLR
jgi:hypothetical protein